MNYQRSEYNNNDFFSKDKEHLVAVAKENGFSVIRIDNSFRVVLIANKAYDCLTTLSTNVNQSYITHIFKDKISTYRLLDYLQLSYPRGTYFNRKLNEDINTITNYIKATYTKKPFVIKPNDSFKSKGISIFDNFINTKVTTEAIEYAEQFSDTILVQDYVEGREFRFICFNNKIQFGIEKFDLPRKSTQCDKGLLKEYQWLAKKIFKALNPKIFCIDIIISNNSYYIVEINSSPGLSASLDTYTEIQKRLFYNFIFKEKIKFLTKKSKI